MKLYALTNMYCMGIQAGIQCQHSTAQMMFKYLSNPHEQPELSKMVSTWATEYNTTVVVNAGDHEHLKHMLETLLENQDIIPFCEFKEPGINNAYSSISLICTEQMVQQMKSYRENTLDFIDLKEQYGYAVANILTQIAIMRTM